MNKFEASNGYGVYAHVGGALSIKNDQDMYMHDLGLYTVAALREFFQHERDQELGRWRWPENPDYVVYPFGDGGVVVLHEVGPKTGFYFPDERARFTSNKGRAARAYFEAHPEPKPWHDAKPGEVWVISVDGSEYIVCRVIASGPPDFEPLDHPVWATFARDSERITAGRRIWPEGE